MNVRVPLSVIILLITTASFSQKLQLSDILKAYSLDSMALKEFAKEKQYVLTEVQEGNYKISHTYKSTVDKKLSFVRTFPKQDKTLVFLYYYYRDRKDAKGFVEALKGTDFKKFRSYEIPVGGYREEYGTDSLELELSTSNYGPSKRAILLYKRVNFK